MRKAFGPRRPRVARAAAQGLAEVAAAEGLPERALRLGGAAAALRDSTGAASAEAFRARHERRLAKVRAAVSADGAASAWAPEGGPWRSRTRSSRGLGEEADP
ncbi:MAG TPA: hypothetical protein VE662_01655 [Solirubrobacterales bacterium]|nr:hypothetical protein [Solirubrobacterales bacterium]